MTTQTLTSDQMKDETVIAKLNQKIADKKITELLIFENGNLLISLQPTDYKTLYFKEMIFYLGITNYEPYLHIFIKYLNFTTVKISEVD